MVSSNFNNDNALSNSGAALPIMNHKKSPLAMKKVALKDVQNDNRSSIFCHPENSRVLGQPVVDAIKASKTKTPPFYKFLGSNIGANEQPIYAGLNLNLEMGKSRNQGISEENADCLNPKPRFQKQPDLPEQSKRLMHETTPCLHSSASISTASPVTFSPGGPSFPSILGSPGNGFASVDSRHQFTSESMYPHLIKTKGKLNQERFERFVHLQNLLKHCDESDKRCYTQSKLFMYF